MNIQVIIGLAAGEFPTSADVATELRKKADALEGTGDTAPKRGRPAKTKTAEPVETEVEDVEADETFEMPEDEGAEPEVEADGITDDDIRERGAKFVTKKGEDGRAKLKALLAKYKAKNLVAVSPDKREAFLKALGA